MPAAGGNDQRRHWAGAFALLVLGVFALSFNLRAAITSLPPIFLDLQHDLGLTSAEISLLAAIPLLSFSAFSLVAAPAARRFGEERVLAAAVLGIAAGLLLRGAAPRALLYPGTIIATGAIALLNVLLSSLIKGRQPARAGVLLALYLMGLYVGSILGSALAVPVLDHAHSVRLSLSMWALPALVAFWLWLPQLAVHRAPATVIHQHIPIHRRALAWEVALFMGLQSLTYYATVSWLPTMLRERGLGATHAGYLTAALSLGGLVTAFAVPLIAHRVADQRALVVPSVVLCVAATIGAFSAPVSFAGVFVVALGFGQGAALALALYFFIARSPSARVAASLSAMSQGFGYLIAAAGPVIVGLVHSATGSWTPPMLILLGFLAAEGVAGVLAARPLVLSVSPEPA